jgi:adenine/guanine phosphoribosyltransferase-like PRPP-binding protein
MADNDKMKEMFKKGIRYENSKKNKIILWNPWSIYLNNEYSEIMNNYESLLNSIAINADYICPIPTSGYPLIPIASKCTKLPIITYRKQTVPRSITEFDNESQIQKNKRVFLVDTNINYGDSIENCVVQLSKIKAEIVGLAVIVFNDTLKLKNTYKLSNLISEEKLYYLSKITDFLQ